MFYEGEKTAGNYKSSAGHFKTTLLTSNKFHSATWLICNLIRMSYCHCNWSPPVKEKSGSKTT